MNGISSDDVNDYLREATGIEATAKTFRTWHASALALSLLGPLACEKGCTKRQVREALTRVAERLGNTVAVCRKSYVHPGCSSMRWTTGSGSSCRPHRPPATRCAPPRAARAAAVWCRPSDN